MLLDIDSVRANYLLGLFGFGIELLHYQLSLIDALFVLENKLRLRLLQTTSDFSELSLLIGFALDHLLLHVTA